jgi:hypothetical protein
MSANSRPQADIGTRLRSPGRCLPGCLDDLDQLVDAVALPARELDELACACHDRTPFPRACDRGTATAAELEQTFVAQCTQRAQHGIRVDPENGGEVTRGRESLACLRLAFGDRAAELGGDLFVQAEPLAAVYLDMEHSASNSSFMPDKNDTLLVQASRRASRRRRWYALAATFLLVSIAASVAVLTHQGGRHERPLSERARAALAMQRALAQENQAIRAEAIRAEAALAMQHAHAQENQAIRAEAIRAEAALAMQRAFAQKNHAIGAGLRPRAVPKR